MIINTVNLAYQAQIELDAENERMRQPHHYPSSACGYDVKGKFCGACRRNTWFSWNGMIKSNPIDAPALFKMGVGNIIHDHLSELIENKLAKDYKIPITDEAGTVGHEIPFEWKHDGLTYPFSGRMDGRYVISVCTEPNGDTPHVAFGVEWKSIYGKGADYVQKDGPKEDALLQCAVYLEQDVLPLNEIENMYVCRDSGYFIGFSVAKDAATGLLTVEHMSSGRTVQTGISFNGILLATSELESHLEAGTVPPKDYGSHNPDKDNKWRCQYCSYAGLCSEYDRSGRAALNAAMPLPSIS